VREEQPVLIDLPMVTYADSGNRGEIPPSPIEKPIPNQLVLSLTAHTWALQNCMSFIPKMKPSTESGRWDLSKLFVFSNMAERVGFEIS
jgi:hypothetical protein